MANLHMRFPNGRKKALTLSYDDGVETDIRLIELMNKHGVKGTFNINSGLFMPEGHVWPAGQVHRRMTKSQVADCYKASGQEIAVHALTHPFLEQLPPSGVVYEVLKDRENLEEMFGTVIRGMAYPFGSYSDETVEALKNCGIAYSRTVISTEGFAMPKDWLRLPATCHHDNPRLMELAQKFTEAKADCAPILFYLWGHSYEFDGNDNWQVIEEFLDYMGGNGDIWYATNIEIYDYEQAFKSLKFSAAMSMVYNPSAAEVWFEYGGRLFSVKPGETVTIK